MEVGHVQDQCRTSVRTHGRQPGCGDLNLPELGGFSSLRLWRDQSNFGGQTSGAKDESSGCGYLTSQCRSQREGSRLSPSACHPGMHECTRTTDGRLGQRWGGRVSRRRRRYPTQTEHAGCATSGRAEYDQDVEMEEEGIRVVSRFGTKHWDD